MPQDNMYEERKQSVLSFFKEAFIVDGEVKFMHPEGFKVESVIELNDSKRGTFYMGMLVPQTKNNNGTD